MITALRTKAAMSNQNAIRESVHKMVLGCACFTMESEWQAGREPQGLVP
jgi:hypothetical protein